MQGKKWQWIPPVVAGGLLSFWLFPLKPISRLAARAGHASPCPAALSWLVDNPIRHRYIRSIWDRIGIRTGERILELGPGPGAFTAGAAQRTGAEGRVIAVDIQPAMIAQVQERVREPAILNTRRPDGFYV
jgi:SAM-dependent methyltransferase